MVGQRGGRTPGEDRGKYWAHNMMKVKGDRLDAQC